MSSRGRFCSIAAGCKILREYTCVHSALSSPCWKILLPLTQSFPAQRSKGQAHEGVSDNRAASEWLRRESRTPPDALRRRHVGVAPHRARETSCSIWRATPQSHYALARNQRSTHFVGAIIPHPEAATCALRYGLLSRQSTCLSLSSNLLSGHC